MDDLTDFADDYGDSAFIDGFAQGTSENKGEGEGTPLIEDRIGYYLNKVMDRPINKAKRPNDTPKTYSRKKICVKQNG